MAGHYHGRWRACDRAQRSAKFCPWEASMRHWWSDHRGLIRSERQVKSADWRSGGKLLDHRVLDRSAVVAIGGELEPITVFLCGPPTDVQVFQAPRIDSWPFGGAGLGSQAQQGVGALDFHAGELLRGVLDRLLPAHEDELVVVVGGERALLSAAQVHGENLRQPDVPRTLITQNAKPEDAPTKC